MSTNFSLEYNSSSKLSYSIESSTSDSIYLSAVNSNAYTVALFLSIPLISDIIDKNDEESIPTNSVPTLKLNSSYNFG